MEAGKNQLYFLWKHKIIVALLTKQPAIQLCRLTRMSVCLLCGADSPNQEISPGETTTIFCQLRGMKHFNPQECITMLDSFFPVSELLKAF